MEDIKKSSEGKKHIEKISRKSKAACKSIKLKLNTIEKDMKKLQDENKKLREKISAACPLPVLRD